MTIYGSCRFGYWCLATRSTISLIIRLGLIILLLTPINENKSYYGTVELHASHDVLRTTILEIHCLTYRTEARLWVHVLCGLL